MPLDENALVDSIAENPGEPALEHELETANLPLDAVASRPRDGGTLAGDAWRRLTRNRPAAIALVYLAIVVVVALTGPLWVGRLYGDVLYAHSDTVAQTALLPPSLAHPMGTDDYGRDIFGRVVLGARVSLSVGFLATLISVVLGLFLGGVSGYYGGFIDSVVMRLTDVFLAFPYILLAIVLISAMGLGLGPLLVAIGLLGWTTVARVFRSSVLAVKQSEYVDAARALGASDARILVKHILPNAFAPVVVYATMSVGGVILTEAALSFLGIGVQAPTPSWGAMLNEAQGYFMSNPGLFVWPGLAIVATVLAFVLLGDGLRDALDVKAGE
jgi:peptide/nickel transport system permease protein